MLAIFKRDFRSLFSSPLGYIFVGFFIAVINVIFLLANIGGSTSNMSTVFGYMMSVLTFLVPILTMRLFSEEMKMRTDQALLTAPVSLFGVVMGKFTASLGAFIVALIGTLPLPIIVSMYGNPQPGTIVGNYIAIIFVAAAMISMGMFISSLTENQLISAVVSLVIFVLLPYIDTLTTLTQPPFSDFIGYFSFTARYTNSFALGVFNIADAIFYISLCAVFVFLTARVLEKKRYS